jgi:phage gpG-like protein
MPGRFSLSIQAVPEPAVVAEGFFLTREKLDEMVGPITEVAHLISREIEANFAAQGRPQGWEALSDATVARRGSSEPILHDTGDMEAAVTDPNAWKVTPTVRGATAVMDESGFPTNSAGDVYASFHITGTDFMPARDWTFIPDDAMAEADRIFEDFITEAVNA